MSPRSMDYGSVMHSNLKRVFCERDAVSRMEALEELYTDDATLYEPHASATGLAAINQAVEALLSTLPPNFNFMATGPAVSLHGIARLNWQSGPPNGPVVVTGTDVARIEDGRIQTLYVFLDSPVA